MGKVLFSTDWLNARHAVGEAFWWLGQIIRHPDCYVIWTTRDGVQVTVGDVLAVALLTGIMATFCWGF